MIISKITSGLGNQLFQYAVAKHLSIVNKTSLYLDLRYYKQVYSTDTVRTSKLHNFNTNFETFDSFKSLTFLSKITKFFPNRTLNPFFKLVKEKYHHYDKEVLETKANFIYLNGFWQSEKYFVAIDEIVRKDLTFKKNYKIEFNIYRKEILKSENPVSIHIRRGDYVHHPEFSKTFGFVGLDYYLKAIEIVKERFHEFRFFIFSDDLGWVRGNFPLTNDAVFVKNTGDDSDIDDLHLMSLCKHHIIANSSFSWWGAWLNADKNKLVIAPKNWYKNQPDWNTQDLIPDAWIKI